MLPEVVLLAEAEDTLSGDADLFVPNFKCLVVVLIDRGIETLLLQSADLGQEFPAPRDCLVLEIVAEGEVAEHLKIGAVAGGVTDVVNIARADALLTGADAAAGRLDLALEIGLHRRHAGVDEQKRAVVLRDERKAGQAQVSLALKEGEEHLAQLVYAVFFRRHGKNLHKKEYTPPRDRGEVNRGTTLIAVCHGILVIR